MSLQIARRYFTGAEYERMGEVGIFSEDDRIELIEGEIVETSPIGKRHAACVDALAELLRDQLQHKVNIRVQNPIQLDGYSEPQPDIAVLKRRADFYRSALPQPADVLLIIEVCDTTPEYDRQIKLPLCARAGIPEVWLVNLTDELIETYAQPAGDAYQISVRVQRGADVQATAIADLRIDAAAVLG